MSPSKKKSTTELFGEVLRELRTKKGISQEALAHECGRQCTYISLLELGKHSPSLDILFLLADALGTSVTDIVRRIEKARSR